MAVVVPVEVVVPVVVVVPVEAAYRWCRDGRAAESLSAISGLNGSVPKFFAEILVTVTVAVLGAVEPAGPRRPWPPARSQPCSSSLPPPENSRK